MTYWQLENAGPDALIIRFGRDIDPALVATISAARACLARELGNLVRDLVPAYTTLTLTYDPGRIDFAHLCRQVEQLLSALDVGTASAGTLIEIPVYYAPEVGPDLERVAALHRISTGEVVRLHSEMEYIVFAIGFAPGFAYMGEVAEALRTPRLSTPRTRVPAGSVALADRQTAVYPVASPGGWNLLGRTAMKMFDPEREGLCPLASGDRVRFVPVSRAEFLAAGGEIG